jgi:hypothetical protein
VGKLSDRITTLEDRLRELKTRQQRMEARKRTLLSQRERRDDTRRKILLGAWVLAQIERGEMSRDSLRTALSQFLTRPDDRQLFGLPDGRATGASSSVAGIPSKAASPRSDGAPGASAPAAGTRSSS